MAKLNNLRQRSLRCVISEESGTVAKYYKQDSINDILKRYDEEKMVKVFNPTTEQKQAVIDILDANNNGEEIEVGGVAILKLMENMIMLIKSYILYLNKQYLILFQMKT
jgi:uncharacterized UPF0160 family protein